MLIVGIILCIVYVIFISLFTKRQWRNLDSGDRINYVIGIITLSGLLITTWISIYNIKLYQEQRASEIERQKTIDDLQSQINSQEYQPKLKILNQPLIISVQTDTVDIPRDDSLVAISPKTITDIPSTRVAIKLYIKSKIKLTNTGDYLGRILFIITTDSVPSVEYMRNYLVGLERPDSINWNIRYFPELLNYDMLPNEKDTLEIELDYVVRHISNQKFNLYTLILYENELEFIYDTYYRSLFRMKDVIFPFPDYIIDKSGRKLKVEGMKFALNNKNLVMLEQSQSLYSSYYKKEDLNNIRELIKMLE